MKKETDGIQAYLLMEKIYIISTNSAVFLDQFVRQINSAISVVYSEWNRRYFLMFQSFCLL